MFKRILIANRGEIAVRIMRSSREMGIETVAVYHEVDKEALFVNYADFAYRLSGETPKSAYLDMEQIINIAKKCDAEAIHPGYGFLSERAEFARKVSEAGIKFIGPSATSIEMMGSKTKARELMIEAGVPVVPGTKEKIVDINRAIEIACELSYPILLKAAAGGGGKGMRKVFNSVDLEPSFEAAQREALKAFGDDSIYLEKFIENPKHIEIQILADEHNNYVHLGERDCSIQRRHQKVIEEAPSTILDDELRAKMGEVAVNAAKTCGYYNAGTVEFLLDKDKNFYFLEMNTRLQVEHPVTEMVTGINLVKEQIKIAYGEKLAYTQDDIKLNGYAVECRIYAEDPFNDFMPDTGIISYHRQPAGYGVRLDSGVESGSEVTIHFDPMLSKLITFGKDRLEAISRIEMALKNYQIKGVQTIIPFLLQVMQHPEFRYGWFDTGFIEHSFDFDSLEKMKLEQEEIIAAIAAYGLRIFQDSQQPSEIKPQISKWKEKNLLLRRLI